MNTKEAFHQLIDNIEDDNALKGFYDIINTLNKQQSGKLYNDLSESEKEELRISYEESFDAKNLVSHEDVKKQHEKWQG
jgi:hypothetical protein